jgi:hypothetical protein
MTVPLISHDRSEESAAAKAQWFKSLSERDRVEIFDSMMEMILENQPDIADKKHAEPIPGRIRVLEAPRR